MKSDRFVVLAEVKKLTERDSERWVYRVGLANEYKRYTRFLSVSIPHNFVSILPMIVYL